MYTVLYELYVNHVLINLEEKKRKSQRMLNFLQFIKQLPSCPPKQEQSNPTCH